MEATARVVGEKVGNLSYGNTKTRSKNSSTGVTRCSMVSPPPLPRKGLDPSVLIDSFVYRQYARG